MQFDPNSFTDMGLTNMSSVIVPVVVIGPGCFKYVGTAFNMAPDGLFVTAAHSLEGRNGALYWQEKYPGSHIVVIWVGSGAGEDVPDLLGGPMWVTSWTKYEQPESDLALLRAGVLKNGEPYPLPTLRLSTRLPRVGERIAGLGYPNPKVESDTSTPELREITLDHSLHVAVGEIREMYEERRDALMMPFAGFQTEAVFESGMSGGPVFNEDGFVCGVISFSLKPNEDYPRYTSYASLALALYALPISDGETSITVYELAKRGFVAADEHFDQLQYIEQDGRVGVRLPRT
jgi:Trypsin-like peptidase domain